MSANASAQDKTEKASTQKLKKSREQGQVPRSRDWATAVGLLVSLHLLALLTPQYLDDFRILFAQGFVSLDGEGALENQWSAAFPAAMTLIFKMVLPLCVIPLISVLAALFPGGWVLSLDLLRPRLSRLDPLAYVGRLAKPRHLAGLGATVMKATALAAVLWYTAHEMLPAFMRLQGMSLDQALVHGVRLTLDGILALCSVLVVCALIDLPIQRLVFLREQRMSKRDVKDEHKTTEGRPEVRQRIRQLQQRYARRGLRKTVPTADVVLVNPTHYAVALKYDEGRAQAPFVLAKGVDEMAIYIRGLAVEHGIEIVSAPPLARAIYHTSQVHQQIPASLYQAVAQVLSYVMQIKAFRERRRPTEPRLPVDLDVPSTLL